MARGRPAVWSALLSFPFLVGGTSVYLLQTLPSYSFGGAVAHADSRVMGLLVIGFGGFICLTGLYVQFVAPSPPTIGKEEGFVDTRHPSQRVALAKIGLSLPLLAGAGYLLFFSRVPYVYPTAVLFAGLYFVSSGLNTYWVNSLTTYYLTTSRVISAYRFISVRRQEIPLDKIRGVEERKSLPEALVGLGNLRIASGGGGGTVQLIMRNITDSTVLADEIRDHMS